MHKLIVAFDLAGTFVFGLSGATAAVRRQLDLFGVVVLSFMVGVAGGMMRDVLIGSVPPSALNDWHYLGVCVLAGLVAFYFYPLIDKLSSPVLFLDAAGLGLFVVVGTEKALAHGLLPTSAALLGVLGAIGGGVVRDVLLTEVPGVLRTDIYALAALAGALAVVVGHTLGIPFAVSAWVGFAICFGLRLMSLHYHWHLPIASPKWRNRISE